MLDPKDELDYVKLIRKIKEDNVKVAFDYQSELKNDERSEEEKLYELPDGNIITLSKELVHAPAEQLFTNIGNDKSLTEMIETSLERCNEDLRQEVMKNAIFCGGSSMIKGLEDRVHK